MLAVLSPAKSMRGGEIKQRLPISVPKFLPQTDVVLATMKLQSKADLRKLMGVSDAIAALNVSRFQEFADSKAAWKGTVGDKFKQAALVMDGPAYRGLEASSLTEDEKDICQAHIRFLSGLYGMLKPGDLIQPYRLEMGTKLPIHNTSINSLYEYWGLTVTNAINRELKDQTKGKKQATKVLVNIASQEYFKVIKLAALDADVSVIECVFKDKGRVVAIHAKRARGLMARFIVQHSITTGEDAVTRLKEFNYEGYKFVEKESTTSQYVFDRTGKGTLASPPMSPNSNTAKGKRKPSAESPIGSPGMETKSRRLSKAK